MNSTEQTPEEAINVVINALEHAQSKGSWGLGDAVKIASSINTLKIFIEKARPKTTPPDKKID